MHPHSPSVPKPPTHIELIARGAATHQGSILLCHDLKGEYYYLPGGHIDPGEAATNALSREFIEETGLSVIPGPLLLIFENRFIQNHKQKHEVVLVFHVEHAPSHTSVPGPWPESVPSLEDHIDFKWIDLAAVIDLDIRPDSTKAWLASGMGSGGGTHGAGGVGGGATTGRAEWISESSLSTQS